VFETEYKLIPSSTRFLHIPIRNVACQSTTHHHPVQLMINH